jgi:hypothetical protein
LVRVCDWSLSTELRGRSVQVCGSSMFGQVGSSLPGVDIHSE